MDVEIVVLSVDGGAIKGTASKLQLLYEQCAGWADPVELKLSKREHCRFGGYILRLLANGSTKHLKLGTEQDFAAGC